MRCSKAFEFTISSKSLLCLGPSVEAEKFYEPVYTLKKYFLSGKPVLGARRELAAALILILRLLQTCSSCFWLWLAIDKRDEICVGCLLSQAGKGKTILVVGAFPSPN